MCVLHLVHVDNTHTHAHTHTFAQCLILVSASAHVTVQLLSAHMRRCVQPDVDDQPPARHNRGAHKRQGIQRRDSAGFSLHRASQCSGHSAIIQRTVGHTIGIHKTSNSLISVSGNTALHTGKKKSKKESAIAASTV